MMSCSQRCPVIMFIYCIPSVHADKWTLKVHILIWGFVFPKANCNTTTTPLRWEPLLITFTLQIKPLFLLPCFKAQVGVQFACRIQTSPCLGSSSDWGGGTPTGQRMERDAAQLPWQPLEYTGWIMVPLMCVCVGRKKNTRIQVM